jgi:hypothetical protein
MFLICIQTHLFYDAPFWHHRLNWKKVTVTSGCGARKSILRRANVLDINGNKKSSTKDTNFHEKPKEIRISPRHLRPGQVS